jgi:shikimate kinase
LNRRHVFLIGPGGVGKSTTGPLLAALLDRPFIDLDDVFCAEIENIGTYMKREGYEAYARANADLAQRIIRGQDAPMVMALSSGSLVTTGLSEVIVQTRAVVRETGVSVMLLPGGSLEQAAAVVVARQLTRGFGLQHDSEMRKFLDRAEPYRALADICVDSAPPPQQVAAEIAAWLRTLTP